jgi:aldose 1-epimerase
VAGKHQKITVSYGLNYKVAVIYAPQGRDFICFEPMAALTNAFNLAHQHIYEDLQTIGPGEHWRENFFITPEGF